MLKVNPQKTRVGKGFLHGGTQDGGEGGGKGGGRPQKNTGGGGGDTVKSTRVSEGGNAA